VDDIVCFLDEHASLYRRRDSVHFTLADTDVRTAPRPPPHCASHGPMPSRAALAQTSSANYRHVMEELQRGQPPQEYDEEDSDVEPPGTVLGAPLAGLAPSSSSEGSVRHILRTKRTPPSDSPQAVPRTGRSRSFAEAKSAPATVSARRCLTAAC
jgi:hypothetical protein